MERCALVERALHDGLALSSGGLKPAPLSQQPGDVLEVAGRHRADQGRLEGQAAQCLGCVVVAAVVSKVGLQEPKALRDARRHRRLDSGSVALVLVDHERRHQQLQLLPLDQLPQRDNPLLAAPALTEV